MRDIALKIVPCALFTHFHRRITDAFIIWCSYLIRNKETHQPEPYRHRDYITQNPMRRCTYWIGIHFAIDVPGPKIFWLSAKGFRTITFFLTKKRVIYLQRFAVSLFF